MYSFYELADVTINFDQNFMFTICSKEASAMLWNSLESEVREASIFWIHYNFDFDLRPWPTAEKETIY